jgi:hypothetical protein
LPENQSVRGELVEPPQTPFDKLRANGTRLIEQQLYYATGSQACEWKLAATDHKNIEMTI